MLVRHAARTTLVALLAALLVPAAALALGLGDIHLESALNAPLDAQIDLIGASTDDLETIKATLAPREDFARYRLDYPSSLGTVTLQPEHLIDGRNVIQVTSSNPATEPFASLLVQVDWAHGHLLRQYTVLIDPPVLTGNPGNTAVEAPTAGSTARSGAVLRVPTAATEDEAAGEAGQAAAPAATTPAATAETAAPTALRASAPGGGPAAAGGGTYTVRRGDTLFSVAASAYGAGDRSLRERQMVAIYRANPQAFNGNANELLAGRQLNLPEGADVAAISPAAAATELHEQAARWKSGAAAAGTSAAAAGRLRLVPPPPSAEGAAATGAAGAGAGTGSGEAALQQQVRELQNQLDKTRRLLTASNAQLAALQARAGGANAAAAASAQATGAAPATPAASAPEPLAAASQAPEAVPPVPPAANTAAAAPAGTAGTPAPANKPAAKTAQPAAAKPAQGGGEGALDLLIDYWYVPAAVVVALILLLVLRKQRARREEAFDRSLDRLGSMTLDVPSPQRTETVPLRSLGSTRKEQSFLVEESGSREQPDFSPLSGTGQHVVIDDSVTGEMPVALDQGDPLAEADFHMAYGLYDQAADLVQIALSREPARRDLKLKLLEVFFVWGNRDRFLQTAHELAASRSEALPGEWEKTVIMGRQIAPDDPLFSGVGSVQGAASAGVDLNLEGGQNRVDFDLLGEPQVSSAHGENGVDLDLGAALGASFGEGEPTGEALSLNDGVDFVLDDPDRGNELTGSTREMPEESDSGNTATVQTELGREADAPTVEQPQLHEAANSTIREKLDAPTRLGLVNNGDQTAELALDDLGLDLGALGEADDTPAQAAGEDQATLRVAMDEHTRHAMARVQNARHEHDDLIFDDQSEPEPNGGAAHTTATQPQAHPAEPAGVAPTATGTWLFSDQDFSEIVGDQERGGESPTELVTMITQPTPDTSPTSRLSALSVQELDLDLGTFGAGDGGPSGVDLDVGQGTGANDATGEVEKIGDDLTLPDLEPVTLSEVGTKLDLARAYMDMGDPEGARSILQEVLTEGSGSQKQEAHRLIDALPG